MATEERLAQLDAALKECISQISSLQQERESELDLKEANKKLICSLVCKQELLDSVHHQKLQLESEFDSLVSRLDSLDKENAFLKCECCALERQLLLNPLDRTKSHRNVDVLVDRLCDLEQENKRLKEIVKAREDELCSSKVKCAQAAYRLELMGADADNQFESVGKEIVQASDCTEPQGCWPQNVLDVILEEHQASERSINDLLEEVRVSLAPQSCSDTSGLVAKLCESDLSSSIVRVIELIEEISPSSVVEDEDDSPMLTNLDYSVHVLRWRNSELISVLRNFVLSCSLVLNGSQGLEWFVKQLASVLEWAVDNCITLDDASRVRERVRKHCALDRSKSELSYGDSQNVMSQMVKTQGDLQEENRWLKLKLRNMESSNKELENNLSLADESNELLTKQLEESRERFARLEEEVEGINMMEDQIEHQKTVNEDLDTQLTVAKVKLTEMMEKVLSLEVELEERSQCCQDLETTCLELQLQLEILSRKGSPYPNHEQIGWEMISDCSKLALVVHETHKESSDRDKKKEYRRCTLRDKMFADTDYESDKAGVMEKAREQYTDRDVSKVLAVVPAKKKGGFGFIRKMFLRRRKCSSSSSNRASTLLQRNASTMLR